MTGMLPRIACMAAGHRTGGAPDLLAAIPMSGGACIRQCRRCGRYVATDSYGRHAEMGEAEAYAIRRAIWNRFWKEGKPCGETVRRGLPELPPARLRGGQDPAGIRIGVLRCSVSETQGSRAVREMRKGPTEARAGDMPGMCRQVRRPAPRA